MKNIKIFLSLVLFAFTLLYFSSCKKENNNEEPNPRTDITGDDNGDGSTPDDSTTTSFVATAGQTAFVADTNAISYTYDVDLNLHVFTAPDTGNRVLTLMLSSLEPGTYEVDFDNAILTYQIGTTLFTGGFNPEGTVIITRNQNGRLTGTFNADVFDFGTATTIHLVDGAFNNLQITS